MKDSVNKLCLQQNIWLRLLCLLVSLYLLYEELFLYMVKRPTLVSETKTRLDTQLFPVLSVCLVDGLDLKFLLDQGYEFSNSPAHEYFHGNFVPFRNKSGLPFHGWSGSGKEGHLYRNSVEMMKRAMLIKNQNASFILKAKFTLRSFNGGSNAATSHDTICWSHGHQIRLFG